MEVEALDHVAISVRDIDRSAKWYMETLGFERLHEGMWGGVPKFVGTRTAGVALFPLTSSNASTESGARILHFAFRTNRSDFTAAQSRFDALGVAFEFQDHGISHSLYIRDPDGHEIEITTYEVG